MITDFQLYSHLRYYNSDNEIEEKVIFSFTLPSIPLSGYTLYHAFDNQASSYKAVLQVHSYDIEIDGNTGYIEFTVKEREWDGRLHYFRISYSDYNANEYPQSNIVEVEFFCSEITNLNSWYFSDKVVLSWDEINTSTGRNQIFTDYVLRRFELDNYKNIDETLIEKIEQTENSATFYLKYKVRNLFYIKIDNLEWIKNVFDDDIFTITNDDLLDYVTREINYTSFNKNLFDVYINKSTVDAEFTISTNYYEDSSYSFNKLYSYIVTTKGTTLINDLSNNFTFVNAKSLDKTVIKILPYDLQEEYLSNKFWRLIKKVLVDSNYYDKSFYAIPYVEKDFIIKGYAYVGNIDIDIYEGGRYKTSLTTSSTGYFEYKFDPKKGENNLFFRIVSNNVVYNVTNIKLFCYNIYTFFTVLGNILKDAENETIDVYNSFFIDSVPEDYLYDTFGYLIDLYKSSIETVESYRNTIKYVLHAFLKSGLRVGLKELLPAFEAYYDRYEIYEHNSHLYTYHPQLNITTSTGLDRGNYVYAVTAVTDTGAETDPITINIDKRWWMFDEKGSIGIEWEKILDADHYRVYRKNFNEEKFGLLTIATENKFVDVGSYVPNYSENPPTFNFTYIEKPSYINEIRTSMNLSQYYRITQNSSISIMLYTSIDPFPIHIFERIYYYINYVVGFVKVFLYICSDNYILLKSSYDTYSEFRP